MVVYGYLKHISTNPVPNDDEEEMWTIEKTPYYYSKETDTYITFIKSAGQNITVSGVQHRAMKAAYSNMTSKGASINDITREFNIPRIWFDEYRRIHGWTHDMLPYTDETILENDNDELVADMILRQRREIHKKYERKKWKQIEDAKEKWFNLEDTLKGMLNLKNHKQKSPS